jgi:hypothetical protein
MLSTSPREHSRRLRAQRHLRHRHTGSDQARPQMADEQQPRWIDIPLSDAQTEMKRAGRHRHHLTGLNPVAGREIRPRPRVGHPPPLGEPWAVERHHQMIAPRHRTRERHRPSDRRPHRRADIGGELETAVTGAPSTRRLSEPVDHHPGHRHRPTSPRRDRRRRRREHEHERHGNDRPDREPRPADQRTATNRHHTTPFRPKAA